MSNAVSDFADPVAKIGDLAASAGVRRIHVLAWRDLEDVEAGGSEVHIAEVAKLWAAADAVSEQAHSLAGRVITTRPVTALRVPVRTVRAQAPGARL